MSITTNIDRCGNFTSSEISALLSKGRQAEGFGADAITYISEKRMERLLGRSIKDEISARPLSWGKLLEGHVFDLLGLDYTYTSTETDVHPTIPYWSGSKDGTRERGSRAVIDIKCPMTLKSFCQLVMPLYCGLEGMEAMNAIRNGFTHDGLNYAKHKSGDKYYWQLVSNAIINGCDWAELIVYMPYQSELQAIKNRADGDADAYWIAYARENEIPYLNDGGYFKNLNVIRFEIPQSDKDLLTEAVLKAGKLLMGNTILITGDKVNDTNLLIVEKG